MEQINIAHSATEEDINTTPNLPSGVASTEDTTNIEENQEVNRTRRRNLLYEECLGFIPNSMKGRQDPRYVYAKFFKKYKDFDFTNEEFLTIIEEMGLLQQLQVLQISKPNKSIDVLFRTEDATDIFVKKHIEIRGKPIPFIRKAKRILRVTVKGVHPEISYDMLLYELEQYIDHCSSIKHKEIHHRGMTFWDGTRQVFVTHLARHIPRSIKIGHRWCLVFYRGQPDHPGRPSQHTPVIKVTPPTDTLSDPMDVGERGPGTSAIDELSEATSEESGTSLQIAVDEAMPEAAHMSKRVRESEESDIQEKESSEKKENRVHSR